MCKGKRSGSRPKREIGVSQGWCVLSTQMLENKRRQQQRFHSLKGRLEQASLIIQSAQSGWHIPLSDSPTQESYLSAITQGFAVSVWEDKAGVFLQNLQTTEELAQRAEEAKDWSQQEALQFDEFAEALQTLSALTPNEAVQTFNLETLTDSLQALKSDFVWQVTAGPYQVVIYFLNGHYGYFDAQVAWVQAISTVEGLVDVFQQGLSVHALTVDSMQIEAISPLETASLFSQRCLEPILTERVRLRIQDEQWGPLSLESGTLSREMLYDLGLQVPSNEINSPEKLLDAQTELTSEKFSQLFEDQRLMLLTQDYLKTLQHLKRPSAQQLNYLKASTFLPLQGEDQQKIQVKNAQNVFKHVEPNQALNSVSSYYWQQILPLETRLFGSSVPIPTLSINQNTGSHTLTNAAGNVLLLKGIADVVQGCRHGGEKDCVEGLLELEFSFFSDAIEKGITKSLQRFKTIQQTKWGKAFGSGVAGVATSLFDIKDFIESLLSLMKAEYGSKTWRDSIAGISFASLGITSSVILLATGASGGVGIVVGVVLVLGQGIYQGISWLEEYKKYALSLDQRIRLFFHGFGNAPPPEDVQYQQARHDYTEKLIEKAQNTLKNASDMSFYIGGLGQVKLVEPIKKEVPLKECLNGKEFKRYNSGNREFAPCMKNIPQPPRLDTIAVTIDLASGLRQWSREPLGITIVANHDMPYHELYKHYHNGSNIVIVCLDNKTKDVALNFNGGIEDQSRYGCKDGFILRRASALTLMCQRAWQTLLPELVKLNGVMLSFINEYTSHQNLEYLSSSTKAQLKNLFDPLKNTLLEKADGLSFYQYKVLAARYNRFCDFIDHGLSGVNEPIIRKILQIEGGDEYLNKMKRWFNIDHWPLFYFNNNLNGKNIRGNDLTNKVFDLYINRAPWIPRGENVRDQLLNEFEEKYGFQGWPKIYFRNHHSKYVLGSWSIVNALFEIYENKFKGLIGWEEWPLFYFNLNLSNSGSVRGSDVGNNLFDIYQGKDYLIQGGRGSLTSDGEGEPKKRTNYFRLFKSDFFGSLEGGDNTHNVLDVSQLAGSTQVFFDAKINNEGEHLYLIHNKIHIVKTRKINQFIGRKGLFDRVHCYEEALEVPIYDPLFFSVDTQGGSATEYDLLFHCQKAVIHPATLIYPPDNREFIYTIKPNKGNTSIFAAINASGAFVFAETDLLSESKFNYFLRENRLEIAIPSKHYSLFIDDFFTKEKTPRYVLRDKGDNHVYPVWPTSLEESVTIQRFLVTGKTTLRTAEAIVAHYLALAAKCEDCQVVSDIETDIQDSHKKKLPERFILGSLDSDVIYLQQNQTGETPISYVRGGNAEDLYILLAEDFKKLKNKPLVIDNHAHDKVLDCLYLPLAKQEIELGINEGDLFLSCQATGMQKTGVRQRMQQFLVLKKYTQSLAHQHLIIKDKNQTSYYPLVRQEGGRWFARLIPFYPAQSDSRYSSLSYEELTQEPLVMISSHFDNLLYCRSDNDLLLVEEASEQKTTTVPFVLNLQDFYTHPNAWRELKLYTVHVASCLSFIEIVEQSKLAMNCESFLAHQAAKKFKSYRLDLTNPMHGSSLAPHQFLNLTQLDLANPMDSDSLATGIAEGEQKPLSLEVIANEITKIALSRGRDSDLLWQFVNDKKQEKVVSVPNWNQKKQRLSLLKYRAIQLTDIDNYDVDQLSQLQKRLDRHFLLLKFQNALNNEIIDEVPLTVKSALIVSLFPRVWIKDSVPNNDENELLATCFGFDSVSAILTFVRDFFSLKDHQIGVSLLRTFENFEKFKLIAEYLLGQLALTIIREEHITLNDLESCFESFIPQDTIAKLYKLIDDGLGKGEYDYLTSQIQRFMHTEAQNISYQGDKLFPQAYRRSKRSLPTKIEKSASIQNSTVYSKQNQEVSGLFPALSVVGMLLLSTVGYFYIRHLRVGQGTKLLEVIVTLAPFLNQVGVQAQASQSGMECNEKALFNNEQCFKIRDTQVSENYVLVLCNNGREFFTWSQDTLSNGDTYLLNYAIANLHNVTNDSLSWNNITIALDASYAHFYWNDTCTKILNLENIPNLKREELLERVPANLSKYRCRDNVWQWKEAFRSLKAEEALQQRHHEVLQRFYQQVNQIGLNYIASECLLHTPVGDFFQLLGLRPDWQAKDHSYFSARCLTAASQLLFQTQDPWSKIIITTSVWLETAVLHPEVKQIYSRCCPGKEFRYGKQAIRLVADLLQFGLYHFSYLPNVIEFLFSDYEFIHAIAQGLRAALTLFTLTNDLSYCYLGIGLFLLPQLPVLLEQTGIPITRYVSNVLDKLAHFFILNSLFIQMDCFKLEVKPDESRLLERQCQLKEAEQRVDVGRQRLLSLVNPMIGFFRSTDNDSLVETSREQNLRSRSR